MIEQRTREEEVGGVWLRPECEDDAEDCLQGWGREFQEMIYYPYCSELDRETIHRKS